MGGPSRREHKPPLEGMPNRAVRRQIDRGLGVQTKKMRRKRQPSQAVLAALRDRAQERMDAQDKILGVNRDPRQLLVPKPPEAKDPKELWTP